MRSSPFLQKPNFTGELSKQYSLVVNAVVAAVVSRETYSLLCYLLSLIHKLDPPMMACGWALPPRWNRLEKSPQDWPHIAVAASCWANSCLCQSHPFLAFCGQTSATRGCVEQLGRWYLSFFNRRVCAKSLLSNSATIHHACPKRPACAIHPPWCRRTSAATCSACQALTHCRAFTVASNCWAPPSPSHTSQAIACMPTKPVLRAGLARYCD